MLLLSGTLKRLFKHTFGFEFDPLLMVLVVYK